MSTSPIPPRISVAQVFCLAVAILVFLPALASSAAVDNDAAVRATVTDALTGAPVAGAAAAVPALGLTAVTDSAGTFEWPAIPLPQPVVTVTVVITAAGYGLWTLQDVRLLANDTLLLTARLTQNPITIIVPPPRITPATASTAGVAQSLAAVLQTLDQTGLPLPATIRVRVTGWPYCDTSRPYVVETVDFREYVKHVLPNEWIASWPSHSLRAGAMAVKMYAWSIIAAGGKWPDADVYDSTCDQVYNPAVAYASTNAAVDATWRWRLMRGTQLVRTYYRAYDSQCANAGLTGNCLGQWNSKWMADAGARWEEILYSRYANSWLSPVSAGVFADLALRFYGHGRNGIDRLRIPLDVPPRPVDVGAADFTIEFWLKAAPGDNAAGQPPCPAADAWMYGNHILNRDVYGKGNYGEFGIALGNERIVFGVSRGGIVPAGASICGVTPVADGGWHHVAVTRRYADGQLKIFVDGEPDAQGYSPPGDISYQDGRATDYLNDPFLVLGAEKHDYDPAGFPAYNGLLDEVRISDSLRYTDTFTPEFRFMPDASTMALYHFDDVLQPRACDDLVGDSAVVSGGPTHGLCFYGGTAPAGPVFVLSDRWLAPPQVWLPVVVR